MLWVTKDPSPQIVDGAETLKRLRSSHFYFGARSRSRVVLQSWSQLVMLPQGPCCRRNVCTINIVTSVETVDKT